VKRCWAVLKMSRHIVLPEHHNPEWMAWQAERAQLVLFSN